MIGKTAGFDGRTVRGVPCALLVFRQSQMLLLLLKLEVDFVPTSLVILFCSLHSKGIAAGLESMTVNQVCNDGQVNPKVELFSQACDCLIPMGLTSENVAQRFGITRVEQDQAAVESHMKAAAAIVERFVHS